VRDGDDEDQDDAANESDDGDENDDLLAPYLRVHRQQRGQLNQHYSCLPGVERYIEVSRRRAWVIAKLRQTCSC
jgi:hypothetical protein